MTLTLLPFVACILTTEGARILAVVPSPAKSHHIIIQAILRTLAEAGHDVTVYGTYSLENPPPNYTDIILGSNDRIAYNATRNWNCLENIFSRHSKLMDRTFGNEKIKKLLRSNEKFDLIITEPYHGQEFTLLFGHKFKAPTIGVHTFCATSLVNHHMGNVYSATSIPQMCYPHTDTMDIWQRFLNAIALVGGIYAYYTRHLPNVEGKMRTYYPDMPPLQDLTKNVSLMFVNEHVTTDYAQPRPPTIVPVAGIHIEPEKPLPLGDVLTAQSYNRLVLTKDIKEFMDSAASGVILLALGTVIPDETKPKEYFASIANSFRNLPQRVIWKTRKEHIEDLPANVMLVKWMPQRDILAHSNCVLFITHGGSASYYEAIYTGVPVVGIPHFADQHRNVAFYVAKEVGVRILPDDISEETFTTAIQTVLGNPKYSSNMKRLSHIFRDTPMSPKQAVVYWTEYVLRHGGAPHLKPTLVGLTWYQRTLLDALAFVIGGLIVAIVVICVIVRISLYYFRRLKIRTAVVNRKID